MVYSIIGDFTWPSRRVVRGLGKANAYQFIVKNGQRVLIGGGIPSRDGPHLISMFLTVKKIDASGKFIRSASFME